MWNNVWPTCPAPLQLAPSLILQEGESSACPPLTCFVCHTTLKLRKRWWDKDLFVIDWNNKKKYGVTKVKERHHSRTKLTVSALIGWTTASIFTRYFCCKETLMFYVKLSHCLSPQSLNQLPRKFAAACGGEDRYFTLSSVEGRKT